MCTSREYDVVNGRYTFTVEQGTRFFLKLKLTADPMPCSAELFKNGALVRSSQYGTVYVSVDRICIQTVYGQGYAGVYKLKCNNGLEGEISFELKVRGTYISKFNYLYFLLVVNILFIQCRNSRLLST